MRNDQKVTADAGYAGGNISEAAKALGIRQALGEVLGERRKDIVLVTKFTHGAWIVVIAIPVIFSLMRRNWRPAPSQEGEELLITGR